MSIFNVDVGRVQELMSSAPVLEAASAREAVEATNLECDEKRSIAGCFINQHCSKPAG